MAGASTAWFTMMRISRDVLCLQTSDSPFFSLRSTKTWLSSSHTRSRTAWCTKACNATSAHDLLRDGVARCLCCCCCCCCSWFSGGGNRGSGDGIRSYGESARTSSQPPMLGEVGGTLAASGVAAGLLAGLAWRRTPEGPQSDQGAAQQLVVAEIFIVVFIVVAIGLDAHFRERTFAARTGWAWTDAL